MEIAAIGLDIAKNVFQLYAVDAAGIVIVRKALRRKQVLPFFADFGAQGLEGFAIGRTWEQLIAVDQIGQRHRLFA